MWKSRLLKTIYATATLLAVLLINDNPSQLLTRGSFTTEAHAIIGAPLTPVSYAGVARRTVRRCAAGVYRC